MTRIQAEFRINDVRLLQHDIAEAPKRSTPKLVRIVDKTADEIVSNWKRYARETAGAHGVHYPKAIGYDRHGLTAIIGPDSRHPLGQGNMSFEYGSRNQPPHLDGNRAADVAFPKFLLRVQEAAEIDLERFL